MSKNPTTTAVFEELNTLYVQFLKKPRKRERIFERIDMLTETICADEKVMEIIKIRTKRRREQLRALLQEEK